jgi:hypothetical protein
VIAATIAGVVAVAVGADLSHADVITGERVRGSAGLGSVRAASSRGRADASSDAPRRAVAVIVEDAAGRQDRSAPSCAETTRR